MEVFQGRPLTQSCGKGKVALGLEGETRQQWPRAYGALHTCRGESGDIDIVLPIPAELFTITPHHLWNQSFVSQPCSSSKSGRWPKVQLRGARACWTGMRGFPCSVPGSATDSPCR